MITQVIAGPLTEDIQPTLPDGGAVPSFCTFGLFGGSHGEISSYDANRRTIEMYGYKCTLLTDTEVITYIIDYLNRKVGLTLEEIAGVVAAPFWQVIDNMPEEQKEKYTYLRNVFSSMLIRGLFPSWRVLRRNYGS